MYYLLGCVDKRVTFFGFEKSVVIIILVKIHKCIVILFRERQRPVRNLFSICYLKSCGSKCVLNI